MVEFTVTIYYNYKSQRLGSIFFYLHIIKLRRKLQVLFFFCLVYLAIIGAVLLSCRHSQFVAHQTFSLSTKSHDFVETTKIKYHS
jgi:hypothetical protein